MAWREVAQASAIPDDEGLALVVAGKPIALFRAEGEIYAIADLCSHEAQPLSMGYFENCVIECPFHQACFDVRTGKVLSGPTQEDVATYPVRVENGAVLLDIES